MRLGKEEAVGYVEDTEADMLTGEAPAREATTETQPRPAPLTPADQPSLPVS